MQRRNQKSEVRGLNVQRRNQNSGVQGLNVQQSRLLWLVKYLMNQQNRLNIKNMIDNFLKYLYSKLIKILVAHVFTVFYNTLSL